LDTAPSASANSRSASPPSADRSSLMRFGAISAERLSQVAPADGFLHAA
jgi:hypothetical protein